VPAAGLADVGPRNPQPLVLRRRLQHAPQQLAITGLDDRLIAQRQAGLSDPHGEVVAHLLQLLETSNARFGEMGGNPGVEIEPRKGLDGEAGKLMLKAADLATQLGSREALIAS
jgi:hypothetical protein